MMEEAEGVLSFDFERGLAGNVQPSSLEGQQAASTVAAAALGQVGDPTAASTEISRPGNRRSVRQTVCRHWLRGLCMKGDICSYLHQLDHSRMPICRFYSRYGECREPDCIFKHSYEDMKECHMYMLGFCPNGPDCRYKHVKLPGPVPSLEETFQKIQERLALAQNGTQSNRYMAQRRGVTSLQGDAKVSTPLQVEPAAANGMDTKNLQEVHPTSSLLLHLQEPKETQISLPVQVTPPLPVGMSTTQLPPFLSASTPLPQGSSRYFVVKSCNRENLDLSVMRGMWATHRNNEAKLNDAFDSCDNVILVFSINETGHFQGCAKMMSRIGVISGGGSWKHADGNARYGRNFLLKWLKLCDLSFHKTWHLRNTYNENLPVKISRDCQELEPTVGEQLASLLYTEPDSELMKSANDAEAKREEDVSNGARSIKDSDCADFNQFAGEYKDEEQSDEGDNSTPITSLNKKDSKGIQTLGRGNLPRFGRGNRGRGRGLMSSTYRMGYDSITGNPADCFALTGMGLGRGFHPHYPLQRYAGQVYPSIGPRTGVGFGPIDASLGMPVPLSRRPLNGLYSSKGLNIMGSLGAPLMAGARPRIMPTATKARPVPTKLAKLLSRVTQNGSSGSLGRNQQKRSRNERTLAGVGMRDPAKQSQSLSDGDTLGIGGIEAKRRIKPTLAGNFLSKEAADSSSEDEAPRRSRYGEGKKKRRDGQHVQGDNWAGTDQQMEAVF